MISPTIRGLILIYTQRVEQLAFTIWRRKWSTAYKSTLKLMNKVNTDPDFLKNLPPAIDEETG